jgi:hypothetical protein
MPIARRSWELRKYDGFTIFPGEFRTIGSALGICCCVLKG